MLSSPPLTRGSIARRYKIVGYPVVEPIDFKFEQAAQRVATNPVSFDDLNRIQLARTMAEKILHRSIVQTTYDLFLDDETFVGDSGLVSWCNFPVPPQRPLIEVTLQYPPCITVQGVYTTDDNGTETLVDPALYMVSRSEPTRIRIQPSSNWPTHRGFDAFRIRFSAGYVIPFTVDDSGFIVASNHGLKVGDVVRFSSPGGVPPVPLLPRMDYTIAAIATDPGATVSRISITGPDGNSVTFDPSNDYAFIGEVPAPIIRAIQLLSTVDKLPDNFGTLDPGRFGGADLPLDPYELLRPFIVPLI